MDDEHMPTAALRRGAWQPIATRPGQGRRSPEPPVVLEVRALAKILLPAQGLFGRREFKAVQERQLPAAARPHAGRGG
jgi:hypothetical protein